jgi:hypothetical protein
MLADAHQVFNGPVILSRTDPLGYRQTESDRYPAPSPRIALASGTTMEMAAKPGPDSAGTEIRKSEVSYGHPLESLLCITV